MPTKRKAPAGVTTGAKPQRARATNDAKAARGAIVANAQDDGLLAAALDYARAGYGVFPLAPRTKVPAIARKDGGHGCKDATTKEDTIRGWWAKYPNANIGIVPPAGCYIVDVDVYKNPSALQPLVDRLAVLHTPMQRSGGGGVHFVLRGDPPSAATLREAWGVGIDVKAHGRGYVMAAPSVHPTTGALYEWAKAHTIAPADAPAWLLAGTGQTQGEPTPVVEDDRSLAPIENAPVAGVTLEVARDVLRHVPAAMWDDYAEWMRLGFALHAQFDGSPEALALWDDASRASPKWEAGACADKWATMHDAQDRNYTFRSVLHIARLHGWPGLDGASHATDALRLYNPLRDPPKRIEYMLGAPVWLPDLPEQVAFFGKSETFKSVAVQGLCVHLAAGVSLDGRAVLPRVVVYAAEEAPMLFDNNLHAWVQHFAATLDRPVYEHARRNLEAGHLQRIDGSVEGMTTARAKQMAALVLRQKAALRSTARAVVVLDPVAEVLQGDESKATDMREYIGAARIVQREADALVWHVHHTGHTETDRERGSSALPAAMFARYKVHREAPDAYFVELHCRKHKAGAPRSPSRWEVKIVRLMPATADPDPREVTGVVLECMGEAAPLPTADDVRAVADEAALGTICHAYRRDARIGRRRLEALLGCGGSRADRLLERAVARGLLRRGGGAGRATYSLTDAGRDLADRTADDDEDDPLAM